MKSCAHVKQRMGEQSGGFLHGMDKRVVLSGALLRDEYESARSPQIVQSLWVFVDGTKERS